MKKIYLFLLVLISLQGYSHAQNLPKLKEKMMDFFCQTLKQNYGKADGDAVAAMAKGLRNYKLHYIIDVDKKKCKKINDELFASALTDYFFDRDTSAGISMFRDEENYDPYQPLISERYLMKPDKETYYQKELQASEHPFLTKICHEYESVGSEPITVYLGYLASNHLDCMDDFKKDENIRMFTTLVFWRYLCYCANIDFRTGESKTEVILKNMEKN